MSAEKYPPQATTTKVPDTDCRHDSFKVSDTDCSHDSFKVSDTDCSYDSFKLPSKGYIHQSI